MDSRRRQKANAIMEGVEPSPEAEGEVSSTPQPAGTVNLMPSVSPTLPGVQTGITTKNTSTPIASVAIPSLDSAANTPNPAALPVAPPTTSTTTTTTNASATASTSGSASMANVERLLNEAPRIEAMVLELNANPEAKTAYTHWLGVTVKKYENELRAKHNMPSSQPSPPLDRIHLLMCMKYSLHMAHKHVEDLKAGRAQSLLKDSSAVSSSAKNTVAPSGAPHSTATPLPPPPVEPSIGADLTV